MPEYKPITWGETPEHERIRQLLSATVGQLRSCLANIRREAKGGGSIEGILSECERGLAVDCVERYCGHSKGDST